MTALTPQQKENFDVLLEQILDELPEELRHCFDEIPLVVEDQPSASMQRKLHVAHSEQLCGVHSGIPLTRRSVQHSGVLPTVITIYRLGITCAAADRRGRITDRALRRQIHRTILHELGHHFGLNEADLRKYGYG